MLVKLDKENVMDVFGKVLEKQFNHSDPIYHFIERDDGLIEEHSTKMYFSERKDWPKPEQKLLAETQPPILDIGCGAGRHTLYLQQKGMETTGIDMSKGAISVCKKRGCSKVFQISIFDIQNHKELLTEKYRTFLLLGNNFGIGGTPEKTRKLLKMLHKISSSDSKIIASYRDAEATSKPYNLSYHHRNKELFNPIGQVLLRIRYLNYISPWFYLYFPTEAEFMELITQTNWKLTKDLTDGSLHYVVLEKV
ncbi:class I SAM-dependent methyltransferase [Candidatus Heimdallarchaeota archaeon]|nr:MAG: class I SAM-dependent methyltransferase [Candidatus Heimdallarchaeota archaeon]